MRIKIKIKTLILLIIAAVIVYTWALPVTILGIAEYLYSEGSDKAVLFYEKYVDYPTSEPIEGKFLYAKGLIRGFSRYAIYSAGWGGGADTSVENIEKAKKLLAEVMNEDAKGTKEEQYYFDSYKMLLDLGILTSNADMLHKWIDYGQQSDNEEIIYTADVYEGFLLHVNGDREGAKQVVARYEDNPRADVLLNILKAEINFFEGNYEETEALWNNMYKAPWNSRKSIVFGADISSYDRRYWHEYIMSELRGNNIIEGTVTYEGKPMPFVEIYVQKAERGFSVGGYSYAAITNEEGEFKTVGFKDGVYDIGIGLDGSLLTDKVLKEAANKYVEVRGSGGEINFEFKDTFKVNFPGTGEKIASDGFTVSWEKVEEAAYYKVDLIAFADPFKKRSFGAIARVPIEDRSGQLNITGTSSVFSIKSLKDKYGVISMAEEGLIGPEAILGIFLPEVEYPVVVSAYDEEHNLISSSLPLRAYYDRMPSVIAEGTITEGEKLILEQKYLQVIEHYENILKDDPGNEEAVRYLVKIYGFGWKNGERNLKRALELSKRYSPFEDGKMLLRTIQGMDMSEVEENKDLIRSLIEDLEDDLGDEGYSLLGRYCIVTTDWTGAKEAFKNMSYFTDTLFYLNMYMGEYEEAVNTIKSEKFRISSLSSSKVENAIAELGNNSPKQYEIQVFEDFLLKLIMGVGRSEGKNLYDEAAKQITNESIRTILYEIYLDRGWDVI